MEGGKGSYGKEGGRSLLHESKRGSIEASVVATAAIQLLLVLDSL